VKIEVKYIGLASVILKSDKQTVNLPAGATLGQLLGYIQQERGLDDATAANAFRASTFMVNKKNADRDTPLEDGDEVLVMRMLGGG
jgi:molybdopterin converting factor small subunit